MRTTPQGDRRICTNTGLENLGHPDMLCDFHLTLSQIRSVRMARMNNVVRTHI